MKISVDGAKTGVKRIFSKRSEVPFSYFQELLQQSTRQVDLIGRAQNIWLEDTGRQFRASVLAGLERGCRYRIALYAPLLPDSPPTHPFNLIRNVELGRTSGTTAHTVDSLRFFCEFQEGLGTTVRDRFEIRVVDHKLIYFLLSRFDETMLVTPYMYSQRSGEAPLLLLENPNGTLFETFSNEFDELWRSSHCRELTDDEYRFVMGRNRPD